MLGLLEKDDVFSCVAKLEGVTMMLGQLVLEALDLVVDIAVGSA